MRAGLTASLAMTPSFEGYPAGSIVVCSDCWKPVYVLERGLSPGDKGGRAASAFRPLTRTDCRALLGRADLDPAWQGLFKAWCETPAFTALLEAPRPRAGSEATCPLCAGPFLKSRAVERSETVDRGYVLEMVTIPPVPKGRHRWLGTQTRWVHDVPEELTV